MSCPNPNYDYADFEDSDDGYDAARQDAYDDGCGPRPDPLYDYEDFKDSDDGYDAVKDNYLTNGGYGYNDRTRQEDKDWHDECRRNER